MLCYLDENSAKIKAHRVDDFYVHKYLIFPHSMEEKKPDFESDKKIIKMVDIQQGFICRYFDKEFSLIAAYGLDKGENLLGWKRY
ncbi:hypothetical protein [Nostoc sp.]